MNEIPVYEAKNRLSYYLHLSDEQGPIFITNHGKVSYVIQSISEFNEARNKFKEEKTIYDHGAGHRTELVLVRSGQNKNNLSG